jgi:hypothetical protein
MKREYHISSWEQRARSLIEDYRHTSEWTTDRQRLLQVWICRWSAALTMERINIIAQALCPVEGDTDMKKELRKMSKSGHVTSRWVRERGLRWKVYELNMDRF